MFKSFINWLIGKSSSPQSEPTQLSTVTHKVEDSTVVSTVEKVALNEPAKNNIVELAETKPLVAKTDSTEAAPVKKSRTKKSTSTKAEGNSKSTAKPKTPKKPKMTVAK